MGLHYGSADRERRRGYTTRTSATIFVAFILANVLGSAECLYIAEVQWTAGARVIQYNSYSDATLLSLTIPQHTQEVFWILRAYPSDTGCQERNVSVFLQPGRYPVISPNNETYPHGSHVRGHQWQEHSLRTNNITVKTSLTAPVPGTWYAAVTMRAYDTGDIRQRGFKKTCSYSFSLITVSKVIEDIWELSVEKGHRIHLGQDQERLYKYTVPDYTVEYSVQISNCELREDNSSQEISPCPISLIFSEDVVPSNSSKSVHCSEHNTTCTYFTQSPIVGKASYVKIIRDTDISPNQSLVFVLHIISYECERVEVLYDIEYDSANNTDDPTNISFNTIQEEPSSRAKCLTPNSLGRYKLAPIDFSGIFVLHDFGDFPMAENQVFVSDIGSISTDLNIDPVEDIGGTLKVALAVRENRAHMSQGSQIWLCMMKSRVPYKNSLVDCPDGARLVVNTSSEYSSYDMLYIPYPEAGRWFISLQSICFNRNDTTKQEPCIIAPLVEFIVGLSPCIEQSCGRYGQCKEYISGVHVFSSCQCFAGWRGYGCTDGSEANSEATELASTLLLSLSNLFFIPGIIVALRRRYFVEALVYFFNMFFSTFYHACDSSRLYYLCIMKYDTLGFGDFMGSIMSFWMTLIAMARLHDQLRSVLHMLGVLCVALWMDYDRHGLWESIVPIFGGIFIVVLSWGLTCFRRRACFPTKWRYIKFLLPGFALAGVGLIIFSFLETEANYMYTHSTWHMVMALSIVFLLPPRRLEEKGSESNHGNLIVNVQDPMSQPILNANMSDAVSLDNEDFSPPLFTLGSRNSSADNIIL